MPKASVDSVFYSSYLSFSEVKLSVSQILSGLNGLMHAASMACFSSFLLTSFLPDNIQLLPYTSAAWISISSLQEASSFYILHVQAADKLKGLGDPQVVLGV